MCPRPLPWVLWILLLVSSPAGSHASETSPSAAALSLECAHDGRVFYLAAVDGETLLATDGASAPAPVPTTARWTLRGDIRTHARLLHWWPTYRLIRDPRFDDGRRRARVNVIRRIDIAPSARELTDPTLKAWNAEIERPLLARRACIGFGAPYSSDLLLPAINHDSDRSLGIAP